MKKIISFDKNLEFNSIIGDVNSISLDHTLKFIDNKNVKGEFLISGSYKLTEASRLEDKFEFKVPVEVFFNEDIDLDSASIEIEDFNYHVDNNDTLVCHIEIKVEGVEIINLDDAEVLDNNEERECDDDINTDINVNSDIKVVEEGENIPNEVNSLFSSLGDSEDTFATYSIYIVRENESLDNILNKYNITKEELENYNDLSNISIGSKLVIPANSEDD